MPHADFKMLYTESRWARLAYFNTVSNCVSLATRLQSPYDQSFSSKATRSLNSELNAYVCYILSAAKELICSKLKFLECFDKNKAHYVLPLLLDPRLTKLTIFMEFANTSREATVSYLKPIGKQYLDILIDMLVKIHEAEHKEKESEPAINSEDQIEFQLFDTARS